MGALDLFHSLPPERRINRSHGRPPEEKEPDREEDLKWMHLAGRMPAIEITYWMQGRVKTRADLNTTGRWVNSGEQRWGSSV